MCLYHIMPIEASAFLLRQKNTQKYTNQDSICALVVVEYIVV